MSHGKLLVGQAGGATAVINRTLASIVREARASQAFTAVWGMRHAVEGALQSDFVDLSSLPERFLAGISATPGAALGSSRHKLTDDEADDLLAIFQRHDIHGLAYIGGNDSADTVHRLAQVAAERGYDLRAIAVPKTIDNDLPGTDHSPGYGSIARYIATATMDSAKDTESMPGMYPVKFIEVMGRNAGWVVASATLGKREDQDAPHLLYLPERPVSKDQLLLDVHDVYRRFGRVVAVVAETLRDSQDQPFADPEASGESDAFGHRLLRGTAATMCHLVQVELGLRARYDKPGSLQRMSMEFASSVDLAEAEAVGREAVRRIVTGETDRMISLVRDRTEPYHCSTGSVDLAEVANRQWLLPGEFLSSNGRSTTPAFVTYARPLLGPEPLPRYARLPLLESDR